jgi:hypothetical protein
MFSIEEFYIMVFLILQAVSYVSYAVTVILQLQLPIQICVHHDIFVLLILFIMYVSFTLACVCTLIY